MILRRKPGGTFKHTGTWDGNDGDVYSMIGEASSSTEKVAFWRDGSPEGVELLRGDYASFHFAPHSHDRYLIALITRGALNIVDPHVSMVARTGQIVLYNSDQIHWGHAATSEGWSILSMYVTPAALREANRQKGAGQGEDLWLPTSVVADATLAVLLATLNEELRGTPGRKVCRDSINRTIERVLAEHTNQATQPTQMGRESRVARQAREFIDANYTDHVSLEHLADLCGVTRYWLIKAFKTSFGIPPWAYLIDLRVRRATTLLREGQQIADIALQCGFSDQSHLTRMLKRALAVTPSIFQKSVH